MAQIAVTILDPSNKRSAHLVETRLPIRELIPPIVTQLKLPERATYQLIQLGSESPMPVEKTLAEIGIPAGAELLLRVVRNQILKGILDKLYEEAEGYVQDELWEMAKEKLDAIWRLDPSYPDPRALRQAVAAHVPSLRSVPPTERLTPARKPAAPGQRVAGTTLIASSPPPSGGGAYQLAPAKKASSSNCLGIILLILAVVVFGSAAIAGAVIFLPEFLNSVAEQTGIALPGTAVLGTGDVQVTLRWQGEADLDLHVVDPNGEEIWFVSPQSSSGGVLDVDANGECEGLRNPVENIYWPTGTAPQGSYEVSVIFYQSCDTTQPTDYEVTITIDGEVADEINAQITAEGDVHPVTVIEY